MFWILVLERRSDLNPAAQSITGALSPTPGHQRNVFRPPGHCDWTQFCWGQKRIKPEPETGRSVVLSIVLCSVWAIGTAQSFSNTYKSSTDKSGVQHRGRGREGNPINKGQNKWTGSKTKGFLLSFCAKHNVMENEIHNETNLCVIKKNPYEEISLKKKGHYLVLISNLSQVLVTLSNQSSANISNHPITVRTWKASWL